jgi:hypothetical protein
MTDPNITEKHDQLREQVAIAQLEEEGYRVIPLTGGGYVLVDLGCRECFAECSGLGELLDYCAEAL